MSEAEAHARSVVSRCLIQTRGGAEVGRRAAGIYHANPFVVAIARDKLAYYQHPDLADDADFDGVRTRLRAFVHAVESA